MCRFVLYMGPEITLDLSDDPVRAFHHPPEFQSPASRRAVERRWVRHCLVRPGNFPGAGVVSLDSTGVE